jgi:hypothetical protein
MEALNPKTSVIIIGTLDMGHDFPIGLECTIIERAPDFDDNRGVCYKLLSKKHKNLIQYVMDYEFRLKPKQWE